VRVLHLIVGLSGGGSERWLRDVVALSSGDLDHRVVTVIPDGGEDPVYAEELQALAAYQPPRVAAPAKAALRGVRRHWPGQSSKLRALARGAGTLAALVRVVSAVRRSRPDVIHSHTIPDFPVALAASRLFRIPLVHTVPCLFSQLTEAGHSWMPRLYAACHPYVACFSTGEGWRELEALHVPRRKILYDLGGVDFGEVDAALARRQSHAAHVRMRLGLPAGCPIALSVGRLHESKGHMLALESLPALLERVPDLHWVVLGEGDQRLALEERIAQLGVQDHAHLVGYRRDPLVFYAAADLYLRSALLEAENFSFYEAMATGLPAVGFATGVSRDLLLSVGNGAQVPLGEAREFADAAARVLQLPDRGRSLGALGAAYARQNLDVRTSVARLAAVYLALAGGQTFETSPAPLSGR